MDISLTYEAIIRYLRIALDILIVWILINYIIKVAKASQKTVQLFQGVILILIIQGLAQYLGLTTVAWLTNNIVSWGFLAIIVIFQPEVRSILERLGKSNALARISVLSVSEKEKLVEELVTATANLSASKTGALITLEQSYSLNDYINTGVKLNSSVSAELLCSIFVTSTPLHDGAVIIQGDKMACASAYFPPTNMELPSKYGARHRAAIGISEITDAVTIVVSEETGGVTVTSGGKIIQMNEQKLRDYLEKVILNKEVVKSNSRNVSTNKSVTVDKLISDIKETAASEQEDTKELTFISGNSELSKEIKTFEASDFKAAISDEGKEDYGLLHRKKRQNDTIKRIVEDIDKKRVAETLAQDEKNKKTIKIRTVAVPKDTVTERKAEVKQHVQVTEPIKTEQVVEGLGNTVEETKPQTDSLPEGGNE